jgi:hypothetical protein
MSVSRESSPKAPSPGATAATGLSSRELLSNSFNAIHTYMEGEMGVQIEEWQFVEQCHEAVRSRYAKIGVKAQLVAQETKTTQDLLEQLPTYFGKVDDLERSLDALEAVAKGLEEYTKALERRFA